MAKPPVIYDRIVKIIGSAPPAKLHVIHMASQIDISEIGELDFMKESVCDGRKLSQAIINIVRRIHDSIPNGRVFDETAISHVNVIKRRKERILAEDCDMAIIISLDDNPVQFSVAEEVAASCSNPSNGDLTIETNISDVIVIDGNDGNFFWNHLVKRHTIEFTFKYAKNISGAR